MGVRIGVCIYDSVTDLPLAPFTVFPTELDAASFLEWWGEYQSMANDDLRLVRNEQAANELLARWQQERDH